MEKSKRLLGRNKDVSVWERFLFFSDLDGTLLNNKSDVSPLTIKMVKMLVDAGHIFCIITGRPPKDSIHIYRKLGLKHLMCNLDGAYIWNPTDSTYLPINLCFNSEIAIKILSSKKVMRYVDNYTVQNYRGFYVRYIPKKKLKDCQFNTFGIKPDQKVELTGKDFKNIRGVDCHGILLQVKNGNKKYLDELLFELHLLSKTLLTRVWEDPGAGYIVEVISKFASKETALDYLSDYYSVPKEMCFAFGDGSNDEGMLRKVTFGYAMMNACPTAKSAASFITKYTNNEDGVARTIKYLIHKVSKSLKGEKKRIIEEYKKHNNIQDTKIKQIHKIRTKIGSYAKAKAKK
ncbi:MAG: HAD-IIB family hydrolase [Malacoplasma sp.]|nr:HAD-IIB family hydrolase [Malacoplasma sp.]